VGPKSVLRCIRKEGCDESPQHTAMTPPGAEDGTPPPNRSADRGSRRLRAVESAEASTAPRASKHPPHNLPLELSSFVGREREVAEVRRLIGNNRLLTLTGSGGCGKTRLALAAALEVVGEFEDGTWWVALTSLSEPNLLPQAVVAALGIREAPGRSLSEALVEHLETKNLLLVLDNCEHLIDACAPLSDTLLHSCPDLHILATSREALGIAGERAWLVPSLSLPDLERLPP
jgi:conflict system STAND superfamily ATPase